MNRTRTFNEDEFRVLMLALESYGRRALDNEEYALSGQNLFSRLCRTATAETDPADAASVVAGEENGRDRFQGEQTL